MPGTQSSSTVSSLLANPNELTSAGAGVSTGAQIPDFRGSKGLFSAGKGGDVKELFHIKCLSVSWESPPDAS